MQDKRPTSEPKPFNLSKELSKPKTSDALQIESAEIDPNSVGDRWTALDFERLAQIVAIIAMGQALHASKIISQLDPASPAINHNMLRSSAKNQLKVSGHNQDQIDASRWRRDGFLFEAISWIAARQAHGENALLSDPHLKSTTQGIDGLIIEWDAEAGQVRRATIAEDKCSDNPRTMFRDEVLPTFHSHHKNLRAPELVSIAASLISHLGVAQTASVAAAARVLDLKYRRYRAALAITSSDDSHKRRTAIFKGYHELVGIKPEQRSGATFVVAGDLRPYFEQLADATLLAIEKWGKGDV